MRVLFSFPTFEPEETQWTVKVTYNAAGRSRLINWMLDVKNFVEEICIFLDPRMKHEKEHEGPNHLTNPVIESE